MRRLIPSLLAAALTLPASAQTTAGGDFPSQSAATINIVQWDADDLPPLYERSSQLPLTDREVARLMEAGFDAEQVVKMIEERRCACDVSADNLIRLKDEGVPQPVLAAMSLHALAPNRGLDLWITLDFTGDSRQARESFLYVFVEDGAFVRVLTANLGDLLARQNRHESQIDQSDIVLPRVVRRIELAGDLPLTTYGPHEVLVTTSAKPSVTHPDQLEPKALEQAQRYRFDYPRSSVQNDCRLTVGYKVDPVLAWRWQYQGSRFECEWN